jgi:hypothetical protein
MANKRIQKKRDKQALILKILKFSYTEIPESMDELRKTIRIMRKMTMPELIRLGQDIVREWTRRNSPLRRMIPRGESTMDWASTVNWRPTISDARERVITRG